MSKVVIYGASWQGGVVLNTLREMGDHEIKGFLDDSRTTDSELAHGLPLLGGSEWVAAHRHSGLSAIVAIGNNPVRVRLSRMLEAAGFDLINVIHPSATLMRNVIIGKGILICAGAIVVSGTRVEDWAVINTASSIDHDGIVESGAYIAPGVHTGGRVRIGKGAFVGIGAVIAPSVTIGCATVIGAGAVVLDDIPDAVLAHGTPARIARPVGEADWSRAIAGRRGGF
jgi:sugar O-acyltransferase (sialic acid O-acetyltransferase NeuD family)